MFRRSTTRSTLLAFSPIALIVAFTACGSGSGNPVGSGGNNATGSGGNGPSSGGGPGTTGGAPGTGGNGQPSGGSSGSGSGGDSNPSTGGNGSGGGNNQFSGVPGAEGYDCSPASGTIPTLKSTPVASVNKAMHITHEPGGDAGRLYVLDGTGKVMIIEDGALVSTPFLDFSSKVLAGLSPGNETGALGLVFHPKYSENGLFYVHYSDVTGNSADSILEEYKVSSDPNVADPTSARLVLKVDQPDFKNHKGGAINFGKDGYLYLGLGDGGSSNDPSGNGQNVAVLFAKILRIDPLESGANAYTVPAGNLKDTMASAAPEAWDYGLRNPYRSAFDGCTGDFYIGDVGQNMWEEINVEKPGEGGKNYGWNTMEGTHCFEPMTGCDETGITMPVYDYDRNTGTSITGGTVYRGAAIPALRGTYFYADYMPTAKVWMTVYDRQAGTISTPVRVQELTENIQDITSIANGADGELYITSLSDGVFKIEAE